jgi:hypothetical protein
VSLFGESAPCPSCGKKVRKQKDASLFLCPHCGQPGPYSTSEQVTWWNGVNAAAARYRQALEELKAGKEPAVTKEQLAEDAANAGYAAADIQRWGEDAVRGLVLRALDDDFLTETEESQVLQAADVVGVDASSLVQRDPDLTQRFLIARVNAGRLDAVGSPTLIPKRGETVYLEWNAQLLKTVTKREYRGGYSGFSFPIGKTGIRYRVGGARGKSVVVGSEVVVEDTGTLSVSSQRAVFMGTKKTMEMPYSKLASLSVFTDGVQFHQTNRVNAPVFRLEVKGTHAGEVVAAVVHAAVMKE